MKETSYVLLVDDNPADIDLARDVLSRSACPCDVCAALDGFEAMAFLRREGKHKNAARPDVIFLDLNLPRKDGRTVLAEAKADPSLREIPIVVFSTSRAPDDVHRCYELGANCYISKPGNLKDFVSTLTAVANFWFCSALLPGKEN
jgi:chemotaxis family two-component system response regulator Rcp1